jgi:hypothetical protein
MMATSIIKFLSLFLCFVRCYHTGACYFYYFCLTWLVVFVAPRRGCTVIDRSEERHLNPFGNGLNSCYHYTKYKGT